jgi:predicted kinase
MITLYAMCGLPFAGKSTAARALQLRTNAVLVQLDAINAERGLGLDGSSIPQHEWQRTYDETYRRIAQHLAEGHSVIFDHGNFSRTEREHVRVIGQRMSARLRFVYVPVTSAEARRRWLRNRETHQRYDVRDDDFELALRMWEAPDGEPDVVDIANLEAVLAE